MRKLTLLIFCASILAFILVMPQTPDAEVPKLGYLDSAKILSEYKPYIEAQNELDSFRKKKEKEAQDKEKEIQELLSKYENQKLLLSEKKRKELVGEITRKRGDYENFIREVFEADGEIYKKNRELSEPIFEEINEIIRRIGEEEGYDFILDVVPLSVVHAEKKYDLTQGVIDELARKAQNEKTGGEK